MGGGTLDPNNQYGLTQAGLDRITNFGLYGQATPPTYQSQNVSAPYTGANTGYPVNGFGQASGTGPSSYQTATSAPSSTFQVASPWGMTGGKGPQTQTGNYQPNPVGRGKGFQSGGAVKGINPERILEVARRVVKAGGGGAFIPHGDPQRDANLMSWFGNSTAHENGVPSVYYHGTSKDKPFNSFKVGRHGAWFTRDPETASEYAESNDSMNHKFNHSTGRYEKTNIAFRVVPAHLKIENPYTGEYEGVVGDNYKRHQSDWFDQLRAKGHDGWMPASNPDLAVVFGGPHQIKSAIGNDGTFDPTNPDIRRADGGEVDDPSQIHGIHVTTRRPGFRDGGAPDDEGFDAYHGTPHTFPAERLVQHPDGTQEHIVGSLDQLPDVPEGATVLKDYPLGRFRDEGIGTGEGEHAYGYGHYSASAEPTARAYAVNPEARYARLNGHMSPKEEYAYDIGTDSREARDWDVIQGLARKYGSKIDFDEANNLAKKAISNRGHILHLRVNANPNHFLDYDKPLEEQHPNIQHFARTADISEGVTGITREIIKAFREGRDIGCPATGKNLYFAVSNFGENDPDATEKFKAAGIPGIRYLDQQSRGRGDSGTHNYVVFDPSKIDIKRRYARGGTVPQGGNMDIVNKALHLKSAYPKEHFAKGGEVVQQALSVARHLASKGAK